jgi:hypothetical protein
MALRLHRVTDEQWQRLAAARRSEDLAGTPARASIGAIEIELLALGARDLGDSASGAGEYRQAATG